MSKAIVIGAGFGGLSAALRLRSKGYEVKIVESMEQAGGRAAVFKNNDFTFDAGPTVITAPYLLEELFELFDKNIKNYIQLLPVDPFYRILFHDGSSFDYVGEEDRILEQIKLLSPKDVDGYKKLAKHAEDIFDVGYTKLADQPFDTLSSMFRVAPDMTRLKNYCSVYSLVSKYIKDERLRQAFSFEPLLVGGNPITVTSIYMLIHWLERKWGVWFVKGGTTQLVDALVKLCAEVGIEIEYNKKVIKLGVKNKKVTNVLFEDETTLSADLVVCNSDPINVYSKWIDPDQLNGNYHKKVLKKKSSMGLFVSYFGSKKKFENIAHHTVILGPRYQGLLKDIFDKKILAEDFSLYLHAPTVTDQSMAPNDHECFYVLSPVPNLEGKIDWKNEGAKYEDKILKEIEKRLLPELGANLIKSHFVTPEYFEEKLGSFKGSGFGIEPSFSQSAYFRFHNRCKQIDGLYFVGANTHPGAGVPGVLNSAKVLDRIIPSLSKYKSFEYKGDTFGRVNNDQTSFLQP